MFNLLIMDLSDVISVNRVRVLNINLAVFDRVFLPNQSLKSTFAQNKSCRSSLPLQLLFWPNFKFQYEIWSFGRSNFGQINSNEFNSVTVLSSDAVRAPMPSTGNSAGDATCRPSANLARRARTPPLSAREAYPFPSPPSSSSR